MPEKTLFLLDAYALIYRAYYAFIKNPMRNSRGLNTSTTFGFTMALDEVIRKCSPSHIAVAFDPPCPTFRHDLFANYKANRIETPEDISSAVPYIKRILEAYRIPVIEEDCFEADDVIGTIAKQAEKKGYKVFMMTPDKDFAQLVSENIKMYKPRRSGNDAEIWGIEEVKKNFEVSDPSQVIDILALWGDTSDNVPGVPGIGEMTAKKIISKYGSVTNLYNHLDDFKGKLKENLETYKDQAFLSRELVTLRVDIPIVFDESEYKSRDADTDKLKVIFEELEFKGLLNKVVKPVENTVIRVHQQGDLFSQPGVTTPHKLKSILTVRKDYRLIKDRHEIESLISNIRNAGNFAFDTENTDWEINKANLIGISFSLQPDSGYFIPVLPDTVNDVISLVKPVFEDAKISKTGHNLKYDVRMLRKYGIRVKGELFDTMIAHYLLEPEERHNIGYLAEKYLSYSRIEIEEKNGQKGAFLYMPVEKVKDYSAEDADISLQLADLFRKEMDRMGLMKLAREVEMPLIYVLADMEHTGIKMDSGSLDEFRKDLIRDIIDGEKKIFSLAGAEFNISSPKQLGDILFSKLKIGTDAKKTKTHQFSTSEEVLVKLKDDNEIVAEVLTYRSLKKLLTTYVEALPKLSDRVTGKIHTSFNQTIAATGRLSSNNPNLQNIPIREERGREIRRAFVPSPSNVFLSADYSQIELRLMAHLSCDENMIEAFMLGQDIHTATAARVFKVDPENVTREMRSSAKTANFGIIYGISAFGLAQRLNISRHDAKELIDNYFNTFPGVRAYMDRSIKIARENGYVQTMMGRKRFLPDINSRNSMVRGIAERNAINAPIQGSAADIIKLAMVSIHKKMNEEKMLSRMILQVHDELNFDTSPDELERLKIIVKNEMETAVKLKVALVVDLGTGKNWLEAH
jgi:DNA polymerase I